MAHRILIADDDQDDRLLLKMAFEEIGYIDEIALVNNGREVLSLLDAIADANHLPLLIVLDLNMPLLDGQETLLQIKNNSRYKNITVIIHSTSKDEKERAKCIELGAAVFLNKSTSFDQCLSTAMFLHKYSLPYAAA